MNKGLSFVPTTKCNEFDIQVDLYKFFRNIRLREYFGNSDPLERTEQQNSLPSLTVKQTTFWGQSFFSPPGNRSRSIERYCRLVSQDVSSLLKNKQDCNSYSNLTKNEMVALKDLQTDNSIIIKPADKGGATVIRNKSDHINECLRQLSDETFYERLHSDPTQLFKQSIFDTLEHFFQVGELTKKEFDFLKIEYPIIPTFYTLPKIHKSLENPPGRPIVSRIGSLTSSISQYVDFFIRPLAEKAPRTSRTLTICCQSSTL